jgi:DNA-binding HxlR family transcriptional regulator
LTHALDVVGDRWTLLIVRDLMPRNLHEYQDILNSPQGHLTNILADRLRRLTAAGLLRCIPHPRSGTCKLYDLTAFGKELIHSLLESPSGPVVISTAPGCRRNWPNAWMWTVTVSCTVCWNGPNAGRSTPGVRACVCAARRCVQQSGRLHKASQAGFDGPDGRLGA